MSGGSHGSSGRLPGARSSTVVITDARAAASKELSSRQKRYAITMAFRTACFIAMIFVPGAFRWVLFGCAVFLPYVAVVLANQVNQRGLSFDATKVVPLDAPQLTASAPDPQTIQGEDSTNRPVGTDEDPGEHDRVA